VKKIYVSYSPYGNDVIAAALCEDGTRLASHLSSNVAFSQYDMGLTSERKHPLYKEHCPEGYELVWVDDPTTHEGWKSARDAEEKKS
jgi:hypothetical protein